jgi:hypothetical protein
VLVQCESGLSASLSLSSLSQTCNPPMTDSHDLPISLYPSPSKTAVDPPLRIRDKHLLRPIDLLPPPPPPPRRPTPGSSAGPAPPNPNNDDAVEKVRALLRRAEAELTLGGGAAGGYDGDVADGTSDFCLALVDGFG